MKAIALLILATCVLVLVWVISRAFTVSLSNASGLLNPTIHLTLHPDFREMFFATLLAASISAYCFAMIAWTEQRLDQLVALISGVGSESGFIQPRDVRLLKEAIRSGDLAAVRKHAKWSAFEAIDDRYLTPLELADLYEHPPIIDALRSAMLKHTQKQAAPGQRITPPSSQFALRRR